MKALFWLQRKETNAIVAAHIQEENKLKIANAVQRVNQMSNVTVHKAVVVDQMFTQ